MQKKIIIASLLALGVTWASNIQDAAAARDRKSITPLLKLNAQFDSNFYKTPANEIDAWTYSVQPGLEAEVETEKSRLALYYTLDAYFYNGLDEDLDFIGHTFRLDTGTRSKSEKLYLNLRDTYRRTRDAAELDYLSNSVRTDEFGINRFDPEIIYNWGLSAFRLAYTNVLVEYNEDFSGVDSSENRGTAEWKYRFNRANALGLNYQYWTLDYDGPVDDYDSWQARAVFSRQSKTLRLEAGAGWQDRNYDMAALEDIDLFVWDFMLQWARPDRTDLTFRADHNLNDRTTGGEYYTSTKFTLALNHNFLADLHGRLFGLFQRSDYEFINREDDTWNFEGALAYDLARWLTLSGAFGYQTRDSDLDQADYDNVYGFAMFTFAYPIGTGRPVISPYDR